MSTFEKKDFSFVPKEHKVPGTSFLVDGFKYKRKEYNAYFLSHFHSDHTIGLTRSFTFGKIYCSEITRSLLIEHMKVKPDCIIGLPMETPCYIQNARVTLIDANHCPGSAIFVFEVFDISPFAQIQDPLCSRDHLEKQLSDEKDEISQDGFSLSTMSSVPPDPSLSEQHFLRDVDQMDSSMDTQEIRSSELTPISSPFTSPLQSFSDLVSSFLPQASSSLTMKQSFTSPLSPKISALNSQDESIQMVQHNTSFAEDSKSPFPQSSDSSKLSASFPTSTATYIAPSLASFANPIDTSTHSMSHSATTSTASSPSPSHSPSALSETSSSSNNNDSIFPWPPIHPFFSLSPPPSLQKRLDEQHLTIPQPTDAQMNEENKEKNASVTSKFSSKSMVDLPSTLIKFPLNPFRTVIHTGDFRFDETMGLKIEKLIGDNIVDELYLDTTFSDSYYKFPDQQSVINDAVAIIRAEEEAFAAKLANEEKRSFYKPSAQSYTGKERYRRRLKANISSSESSSQSSEASKASQASSPGKKTTKKPKESDQKYDAFVPFSTLSSSVPLFLIETYTIGKEIFLKGIAEQMGRRVYVSPAKLRLLEIMHEDSAMHFTVDARETNIRAVGARELRISRMHEMLSEEEMRSFREKALWREEAQKEKRRMMELERCKEELKMEREISELNESNRLFADLKPQQSQMDKAQDHLTGEQFSLDSTSNYEAEGDDSSLPFIVEEEDDNNTEPHDDPNKNIFPVFVDIPEIDEPSASSPQPDQSFMSSPLLSPTSSGSFSSSFISTSPLSTTYSFTQSGSDSSSNTLSGKSKAGRGRGKSWRGSSSSTPQRSPQPSPRSSLLMPPAFVSLSHLSYYSVMPSATRPYFGYRRVVGFLPSGWNFRPLKKKKQSIQCSDLPLGSPSSYSSSSSSSSQSAIATMCSKKAVHSTAIVQSWKETATYGLPYSEHSSFNELVACLHFFKKIGKTPSVSLSASTAARTADRTQPSASALISPAVIIPTVVGEQPPGTPSSFQSSSSSNSQNGSKNYNSGNSYASRSKAIVTLLLNERRKEEEEQKMLGWVKKKQQESGRSTAHLSFDGSHGTTLMSDQYTLDNMAQKRSKSEKASPFASLQLNSPNTTFPLNVITPPRERLSLPHVSRSSTFNDSFQFKGEGSQGDLNQHFPGKKPQIHAQTNFSPFIKMSRLQQLRQIGAEKAKNEESMDRLLQQQQQQEDKSADLSHQLQEAESFINSAQQENKSNTPKIDENYLKDEKKEEQPTDKMDTITRDNEATNGKQSFLSEEHENTLSERFQTMKDSIQLTINDSHEMMQMDRETDNPDELPQKKKRDELLSDVNNSISKITKDLDNELHINSHTEKEHQTETGQNTTSEDAHSSSALHLDALDEMLLSDQQLGELFADCTFAASPSLSSSSIKTSSSTTLISTQSTPSPATSNASSSPSSASTPSASVSSSWTSSVSTSSASTSTAFTSPHTPHSNAQSFNTPPPSSYSPFSASSSSPSFHSPSDGLDMATLLELGLSPHEIELQRHRMHQMIAIQNRKLIQASHTPAPKKHSTSKKRTKK
ncbi:putative DNA repair metallo-beta-lactamase domain-containing protein [Monocercomonoides exilis]|uniref:putative DNA repair metallo-beta-lactamase domain-containing protein n=1 Tax=Monocercomonoides exilis TaxID=2049356 RepID=UPI003559AD6B|nr:putative DNA repair metallo-beta-lactamase domain-containing protein [Monocercomonoides exilis]|eukprot:MONOS_252.1-p1 / transcript=MONOS_252.1 / gene=MONOS_252 / organism=Monocercomonoides_exilis_PA203 / gene_product=DNA repair metallo-beta-lactamase domain-containing protein / transcript_product=DNA repair metallo-beta-lactamase domain-containing protein / location=Mono_scaffold00004:130741-135783(+) / protein_length=1560 / sequence_SO=supercontig / SO=protein_coding / is_pseudo=false